MSTNQQAPLPFAPLSSVQCPQPAHFVSARPTTSTSAAAISTSTAVLVAVAKGRSTTDRLAIPQARPRRRAHHLSVRLPFPSRWGPSAFDLASPSPVRFSSSSWVRSHGSIPPLQPAHRCSSDPQPPSAIGPPSSSTASASSYPPTPQPPLLDNKASHRPGVVHQGAERTIRLPSTPPSHVARRLSCTSSADPTTTRRRLGASARCIFDLPVQPTLSCAVLTCRGFSLATARLRTETGDPLPAVAGCRLNRPHSGSSAFLQDAFRPLFFFCAPASRKSRLSLLQPVPASRSRFPLAACPVFGPPMRRAAAHIFLACRFSRT